MQCDILSCFALFCFVLCDQNKTLTIYIFKIWITQIRIVIYHVWWKYIMHARHMPAIAINFENIEFLNLEKIQTNPDKER